ncbi:hypothetical protein B0T26DRAFT_640548 [Lasiosphaeria miniovina]|uniref:Modin n=1 Tax=Lasiosphaeria miniovina TaxID=1954250 RepID=A0AA40AX33_9PEZI|nr:uncharacterized protein B0T26DRAFT_640548 [Lasiosphaeria miniovina]KAK0723598.1 hypothetical protein B0T26DRAFT_640548 [Lasiosphaeria miniovina]
MSSNSGNSGSLSDEVAIAALVISTLALLGVVLQYVQAVMSRVTGLASRDREVAGLWANHTKLKWRGFFRIDVEFEAPIIFLAPSNNTKGPVEGAPIWFVKGTNESRDETRVKRLPSDPETAALRKTSRSRSGLTREPVHTVKNELATWIRVLEAAQKMEGDSKKWEREKWHQTGMQLPAFDDRVVTLSINIQAMRRSFEKHPTIKKPFATTTICHLVELCAVLGIYWKEFDRDNNKYRAEGNGYSLLGLRMPDLGLAFTFEKPGWPRFDKNRVIPTAEVKELCFGNVPTFYRPEIEDEHWKQPVNEQTDLKTLQLGSRVEIAETLSLLRCNEYTTQCYSEDTKKHVHLFPVIFEVMGMLARPLHLEDRAFTYLPNPAVFPFSKQAFSLRRLLKEFSIRLIDEIELASYAPPDALVEISNRASKLNRELPQQDGDFSPTLLNGLHKVINDVDKSVLSEERNAKDVVLDVLRRHVQEVLLAINTSLRDIEPGDASSVASVRQRPNLHGDQEIIKGDISFDDLLKVPHEKRESSLMDKYFDEVRLRTVSTSAQHHDPQAAEASRLIHSQEGTNPNPLGVQQQALAEEREEDDGRAPEPTNAAATPTPSLPRSQSSPDSGSQFPAHSRRQTGFTMRSRAESWRKIPPTSTEIRRHTIWCALVFRMICWLLLHDFDKKDVQLPKSELMGSRLAAFIM